MENDAPYSRDPRPEPDVEYAGSINRWLVLLLLVLVGVLLFRLVREGETPLHDPTAEPRAVAPRGDLASDEKSTIEVFQSASPSVVHVTNLAVRRDALSVNVLEVPQGTGSGFIWDADGHVVTNFHVIQGAQAAKVTLADNSTWDARLVGVEPDKDLAVLKIDAPKNRLKPILIGESSNLQVGQKVFAIGNPFELDQTLTTGVISGLGREIQSVTNRPIQDVIQTDAAINPGNSGGPLLDSAGRLIGVNTAIASQSGGSQGVGFAVPVDTVNRFVPPLIRYGRIDRPGLGIYPWNKTVVDRLGLTGVLVRDVVPNGGAAQAGMSPTRRDERGEIVLGDLIVAIEGSAIKEINDLFKILDKHKVGDTVRVTVIRLDKEMHLQVTLQRLPSSD